MSKQKTSRTKHALLMGVLAVAGAVGLMSWLRHGDSSDTSDVSVSSIQKVPSPIDSRPHPTEAKGNSVATTVRDTKGDAFPNTLDLPVIEEKRVADGTRVYTAKNGDVVTVTTNGDVLLLPKEL